MKLFFIRSDSRLYRTKGILRLRSPTARCAQDDSNADPKPNRAYLCRVVAGAVADFVIKTRLRERDFDAAKVGVGELLLGVVTDQVLGAQLVGDLMECDIELGGTGSIKVLSAGL